VNINARLQWEKIARVFQLDDVTRDRTWHRMSDLGISPDDPVMVLLALAGLVEKAAAEVPAAIKSIPERTDAAASHIAQRVLNTAIQGLRDNQQKDAEIIGKKIARQATKHFTSFEHLRRLRVSAEIAGLAIAIAIGCGMTAYTLGRASVPQISAEWTAFMKQPDAPYWRSLAQANAGLAEYITSHCGPGGTDAFVDKGINACKLPLWMESRAEPEQSVLATAQRYVSPWLPGRPDLILLAAGFFAAIFGRKLIRCVTTWRPLRWLFDL
jgi:hypothetical protein